MIKAEDDDMETEIHHITETSAGSLEKDINKVLIKEQSSYFRNFSVSFCFSLTFILSQSHLHWDAATSPITIINCSITVFP